MVYYTEAVKLDFLFEALSNRHRRDLIGELSKADSPISISDFAHSKKLSLQNAGKHVKKLEEAKLIRRKKIGVENYLLLNQQALLEAEQWIEEHRKYWNRHLDSLETYVEQLNKEKQ
jgi:DNA-binding transcriptional ArsR family regulator